MTAAVVVFGALLAGVIGTTFGLVRAEEKRQEAEQAREREKEWADGEATAKLAERAAREAAERNLRFAEKGNEILGSVFDRLDPNAKYETVGELRNALKAK